MLHRYAALFLLPSASITGMDRQGRPPLFERYVAIGDSSTEGQDDPDGSGGFRGWADRLAEMIAGAQGSVLYANLAVSGREMREIREGQLERALELRPDLATVFGGMNDVIARRFDGRAIAADLEFMQRALIGSGATVLCLTLPDFTPVMPLARLISHRVRELNDAVRSVSSSTGALVVDLAAQSVSSDRRLWSEDRLHANSHGHARIATALAHTLGLPGADSSWAEPLPGEPAPGHIQWWSREIAWANRHLWRWLWRRLRGLSSGDERGPKRPQLSEVSTTSFLINLPPSSP